MPGDLSEYLWSKRLLLVVAPSPSHLSYKEQMALLVDQTAEIDDRRLVVIPITERSEDGQRFRRTFGIGASEFRVILVGLDGGIKRDSREPVSACDLFTQIDAMPMRREELKSTGRNASC